MTESNVLKGGAWPCGSCRRDVGVRCRNAARLDALASMGGKRFDRG